MTKKSKTDFVKVKPVVQDIFKSAAGGMAAACASILALWFTTDQPLNVMLQFGLALNGLAIPILIFSRYITSFLDGFETVSKKADIAASSLFWGGLATAYLGYSLLLLSFSKLVACAFFAGLFIAGAGLRIVVNQIDKPGMRRRGAYLGRSPKPRHGRVDLGEPAPSVPAPSD